MVVPCHVVDLLKQSPMVDSVVSSREIYEEYAGDFTCFKSIFDVLGDQLKETIAKLEEEEIIASVDKPTDWVHNHVITEKRNGSLRICLDPRPLNKAIKRERYQIPTPSDVQSQLHGKKIFTVIDMKDGFWHVRMPEKSSYLFTFHTPWGRKRFMRMPFGISSASEVMQKRNEQTFSDIVGVHIIADDMIIAASD